MNYFKILILSCAWVSFPCLADWNQWRGPYRSGKTSTPHVLNEKIESSKLVLAWESQNIPSGDEGGFGSVITDGKYAYLSLVWHRDLPTESRTLSDLVLRKLGARKMNLPEEIIQKAERDRLSLSPRLRGIKLEAWISEWLNANLSQRQRMQQGDLLASRFKQGKLALPAQVIRKLHAKKNQTFASQVALDSWLETQGFDPVIQEKISQSVPPTKRVADDVVLALHLETGKQKWTTSLPGKPSGRASSSTPCINGGSLFAVGSNRIFSLELESGKVIWDKELDTEAIASSPLCMGNKVVALVGNLVAFDRSNGEELWVNRDIKGKSSSPISFLFNHKRVIACNGAKEIFVVDWENGETLWKGPGGGSSTPTFENGHLLVHAKDEACGLIAYKVSENRISESWRYPKLTRRSDASPIIFNDHAYLIGSGMRACFDVKTGKLIRKEPAKHDISSPVMSGSFILAYEINGSFLNFIDCGLPGFELSHKTKINALRCTSPCLLENGILVRQENRIAKFNYSEPE